MPIWSEDLSGCSFEDVLELETTNREWRQELRRKIATLINSRLAKLISLDEYTATRKLADLDASECKRRSILVRNEIACRSQHRRITRNRGELPSDRSGPAAVVTGS